MTGPVRIVASARPPVVVNEVPFREGNRLATVTMRLRSPAGSGATRMLEYRQFRNAAARTAFLIGRAHQADVYDVIDVVVPGDSTHLIVEPDQLIQVVTMRTDPQRLAEVVRSNVDETHEYFRPRTGFVGAAIHAGPGGRILELLAWRSAADLAAAASTDRFRAHLAEEYELARDIDIARYDLV